ncbi:MAG: hypothetical protein DRN99_03725 [Thermoproteota archaeon]|nr:MAG: hypothetical protein DRN99_03725 [Candidatus Korarchaeota archaeon]
MAVYLRKTGDRVGFVREVLRAHRRMLEDARGVLVKPNVVSWEPYPTTTHPDVLRATLEFLEEVGVDYIVADGPAFDAGRSSEILSAHPLNQVCREFNKVLEDMYAMPMEAIESSRGFKLAVHTPPKGYIILSLPVLKAHFVCKLTAALKNQFGLLAKRDRILAHLRLKNIHKCIAELNARLRPALTILDAIEVLVKAQELRHGGRKATLGYMAASTDPVALDTLALELLRKVDSSIPEGREVEYIKLAEEYGVGSSHYTLKQL